jgi:O-antigen/teichoic acid export membrane protein
VGDEKTTARKRADGSGWLRTRTSRLFVGKRGIFSSTAVVLGTRFLGVSLSFVLTLILARVLGPSGQGIFTSSIVLWSIGVLLAGFGVSVINSVYLGQRRDNPGVLVTNSIVIAVASLVIAVALLVVTARMPSTMDLLVPRSYLQLFIVCLPLGVAIDALSGLIWGLNELTAWSFIFNFLGPTATLLTLPLLLLLLHPILLAAFVAWFSGQLLVLITAFTFVARALDFRIAYDSRLLSKYIWFGIRAISSRFVGLLNFRLDILVVLTLLGPTAVGLYSIAVLLTHALLYLPNALATSLLPVFSSGVRSEVVTLASRSIRMVFVTSATLAFGLALVAYFLLPMLGPTYSQAYSAVLVLLPGTVLYSHAAITNAYWDGYARRPQLNLFVAAVSLVLDLILLMALIPRLGILGASIASTVSYTLATVVSLWLYSRHSGATFASLLRVKASDVAFAYGHLVRLRVARIEPSTQVPLD